MSNLLTPDDKVKVVKSPFSAYENEKYKFDGQVSNVRLDDIMTKVKRDHIVAIDFVILEAVSELEFATSRMVTKYLEIRGVEDMTQDKVHKRLKFLNKCKVVSRYYFTNDESETNVKIYCLERHGKTLLLGRNYPCKWKPTDSIRIESMKQILARNQVLLAFREKAKNIKEFKINPPIKLLKSASIFNPSLSITLDLADKQEEILFEVVRSYDNYIETFISRLRLYEEYYNYFMPSSDNTAPAKFIIVGEDDKHLFEIFKAILKSGIKLKDMEIVYTHDLRILDNEINKSFIRFEIVTENGKNKAKITELNYSSIQA